MDVYRLLALGVAVGVLAGCARPMQGYEQYADFGNAIAQDMAVHIIDPAPVGAENTAIDMNGERAALAMERYATGQVIEPEEVELEVQ